jgi:putative membrane protein
MRRFLVHWLTITIALGVAGWLVPGIAFDSVPALLISGVALGLANAVVRPLLFLLTLPITLVTLGLFFLVINGVAFALAAWMVPGFHVASFGTAVLGALVVSVLSTLLAALARDEAPKRKD